MGGGWQSQGTTGIDHAQSLHYSYYMENNFIIFPFTFLETAKKMFVCIFVLFGIGAFAEDGHTSMFNSAWLKSVVSIEQLDTPTNSHPIGTGFILLSTNNHLILVTAKHVVLNADGNLNPHLGWLLNEKTNASD